MKGARDNGSNINLNEYLRDNDIINPDEDATKHLIVTEIESGIDYQASTQLRLIN